MKLTGETKVFLGIIVASLVLIGGAVALFSRQENLPPISRSDLIPPGTFTRGNASASAYLVEFSDLQCPACKAFAPIVESVVTQYNDKLLYAYRHFPLSQHPFGMKAALAAEAANRQGKFWDFHKAIFADQEQLSDEIIQKDAEKVGLNMEQFNKDRTDPSVQEAVNKDQSFGNSIGINSTPSFYLNGKLLNLSTPQSLQQAVDEAIK